jgi:hypothetical protein
MVDAQTISIVFAGLSIGIAAFYYISTLRNTRKNQELQLETRQAQLLHSLHRDYTNFEGNMRNREFMNMEWEDYEDFERKYGSDNNPEAYAQRLTGWFWSNNVGIMLKAGLLDSEMVYDSFGSSVIIAWKKWESIIKEQRIRYMGENWMEHFEYLIDRMTEVQRRRGVEWNIPETFFRYISDQEA